MNVLLTGGTGFVGSHLGSRLVGMGRSLVVLVRNHPYPKSEYTESVLGQASIVRGDVRDTELLHRVMAEYDVTECYHLAAQAMVGAARRAPASTLDINVRGTWSLLEAARRAEKVERIVLASSDKAYGVHAELPYTESYELKGRGPYDVSKSCADLISQSYAATYEMDVRIARPSNIYGPGDLNWSRLIPSTIRSVLMRQTPVIRSDGTPMRDYVYIDDVVEGYLAIAERGEAGEAYNLSSGLGTSVLDLFRMIVEVCGCDVEPEVLGEAKEEIDKQFSWPEKASRCLGWQPTVDLADGLIKTAEWYSAYLGSEAQMQVQALGG